ncbi:hypothetical protein A2U01_0014590 [Trifolium medium]|uniref:Uncharacterized protein n=1 Tax=Trifolium medium TaxID=97028 RepID=A0A392N3T5_9FABA|nr:hypothetical protein [Trifolium medium]
MEPSEEVDEGVQEEEEMNQFEDGVHPNQQQSVYPNQQQHHDNWPFTHSEHERASLLHNLDINTVLRLSNVYYNTQGALYTEAMTYRQ